MEIKKLSFPEEEYLKKVFEKQEQGVSIECGSVVLSKGQVLSFKALDFHEIAYLISGKLKVSTQAGDQVIMNSGDLIYLGKEEIRKTETLVNSKILFFLFKES
jgi:ethanolamine utilization protein EutQ (cupin superfamily)